MNLIAAVDENWGIGYKNNLLISIPQDMKFFRESTKEHVVVMGRKTLESFPGGNPLKKRTNIVLTGNRDYQKEGAIIVHDLQELKEELSKYNTDEVFVIGGGSIYKLLLPLCTKAYITKIEKRFSADTYFPNLDADLQWTVQEQSEHYEHEGVGFSFLTYKRV